jgi:hypothetical protein
MQVARIRGVRPERDLAFAAVHQLCASMVDRLDALPGPQRDALAGVFGLVERRVRDGPHPGLAVLALLSPAAQDEPLLCVVDDAQWLDVPSAEAVAFAARRLDRQRIAFVVAAHEPGTGAIQAARVGRLGTARRRCPRPPDRRYGRQPARAAASGRRHDVHATGAPESGA